MKRSASTLGAALSACKRMLRSRDTTCPSALPTPIHASCISKRPPRGGPRRNQRPPTVDLAATSGRPAADLAQLAAKDAADRGNAPSCRTRSPHLVGSAFAATQCSAGGAPIAPLVKEAGGFKLRTVAKVGLLLEWQQSVRKAVRCASVRPGVACPMRACTRAAGYRS